MIKVLFICHGNICRSPMAEYLFIDYVNKLGMQNEFIIESRATSTEEIGNGVHYGTKRILNSLGIDCSKKKAQQLTKTDYLNYDYLIGMDDWNIHNILRIVGKDIDNKVFKLLDFTDLKRDIKDPWYTHNFNETYEDIKLGLEGFYNYLLKNK
ncbi:MAG: low molecular weight phosphotyrosine protein phosphatase, partial [Acholeplasmatales bacterium]|nr:low molecular weight phosphotyrosine protein phosphatase [Acholeplasmatales bacterium]